MFKNKIKLNSTIKDFLYHLVVLVFLGWVMFGMVFGLTPMKSEDMSPKISAGDLMLYYRIDKKFLNGDAIVFEKEGKQYTGRVIAKPLEKVEITDEGHIKVNDSRIIESHIFYTTPKYESSVTYPLYLSSDEYFVLCDYREGAKDSRYFGAVKESEIKGKVITILRKNNI